MQPFRRLRVSVHLEEKNAVVGTGNNDVGKDTPISAPGRPLGLHGTRALMPRRHVAAGLRLARQRVLSAAAGPARGLS